MPRPWYQEARIQAAVVGGIFLLAATVIGSLLSPNQKQESHQQESSSPERELSSKTSEPPGIDRSAARILDEGNAVSQSKESFSTVGMAELYRKVYNWDLTELQRRDFLAQHIGKRVVWEAPLATISEARDGELEGTLAIEDAGFLHVAFLSFPASYRDALLPLKPLQRVRVTCVLSEFRAQARLDDCALVRIFEDQKAGADEGN